LATQQHHATRHNCNEYSASAGKSTRVRTLEDIDSLEALIEIVLKRWPNHRKDDWQLVLYYDALSDLVDECGFMRVKAAVRASFTRCNFLPEPPELRELLPSVSEVCIQPPEKARDPNCSDCGGNGWKLVKVLDRGQLQNRATRCTCKAPATQQPEPTPDLAMYHSILKDAVERSETERLGNENRRVAARAQARAALKTVTERMERERATPNKPAGTAAVDPEE
jgi:hypothetical protein